MRPPLSQLQLVDSPLAKPVTTVGQDSVAVPASPSTPVVKPASHPLRSTVESCIGAELRQVEKLICAAVSSRYPRVAQLCCAAASMGGKRLRPMLVWLSAIAVQQPNHGPTSVGGVSLDSQGARDLSAIAAAVELVHAASLTHDDVMDGATHRRHLPTFAHQLGNSSAILLGDLLFTRAYALAAGCRGTLAARQIAAAGTRLCEGELLQQLAVGHWTISLAEYRQLLQLKTGALCSVSCRLGAWRAGAPAPLVRSLSKFGSLLGLAFQIQDDWLDYWGTEQVGKTLGTDLAQAKPTLPLIRLLSTSPVGSRASLLALLNDRSPIACRLVRERLDASDAGPYTLQVARRLSERAKAELDVLAPSPAKECLMAIADYSVQRQN